jgi:hypothetical protein
MRARASAGHTGLPGWGYPGFFQKGFHFSGAVCREQYERPVPSPAWRAAEGPGEEFVET